jgi:hypothetical protein
MFTYIIILVYHMYTTHIHIYDPISMDQLDYLMYHSHDSTSISLVVVIAIQDSALQPDPCYS